MSQKQSPLSQQEPWDLVSEGYVEVTMPFLAQYSEAALNSISIPNHAQVLDLACGPGTTSFLLADKVKIIVALDFSPRMIAYLNRLAKEKDITNLTAMVGDGQQLTFAEQSFDLVVSMFGFMFFPDKKTALTEVARVLKPGGLFLLSSWAPISKSPYMQAVGGAMAAAQAQAPRQKQDAPKPFALDDKSQFEELIADSVFTMKNFNEIRGYVTGSNAEEFFDESERGAAPIQLYKKSLQPGEWQQVRKKAISFLQENYEFPCRLHSTANIAMLQKKE